MFNNRIIQVPEQLLVDIQANLGEWLDEINFQIEYFEEEGPAGEEIEESWLEHQRLVENQMSAIEALLSEQVVREE